MALTNYWWLIIWMFTGGLFLAYVFPKQYEIVNGKKELRWGVLPAILMVVPYIVWAGFRRDNFGDTGAYRKGFYAIPTSFSEFPAYFESLNKDKGFSTFSFVLKQIFGNSDVLYFLILATIQMLIIAYIYRKYSCNYWMSIFLFIASTDYLSFAHNGLRQFLAVTIILAATPLLLKKKYIPVILLVLLASTMHASAILMLPVVFIVQGKAWNKKTIVCIIITVVILVFVNQFTSILDEMLSNTQYSNMVTDWTEWEDDGTNPIRVFIYCIPMILSIVGLKWIRHENNSLINVLTNFSIVTAAFALVSMVTSGIFIGRLMIYGSVYSTSLLLPWEIKHMFEEKSARLINGMMIISYVALFYYQVHFGWRLI